MRPISFALLAGVSCAAISQATSGTLQDVQHIVIFMQENRAFDHYYGVMRGVRGFNDRTSILMPSGKNAFYQPTDTNNLTEYMLPFHVDTLTTSGICMDAPQMDYITDIGMWNNGRMDAWNTARAPGMGMGYFMDTDLPYYYALAEGFTIGDQYFQSTFTQTNPNRLHLFTGSNGLSVGQLPTLDNFEPFPGFTWPTFAETLQAANISWKVYQQPDNFDDNAFAWFKNFQEAPTTSPLYQKGMAREPDIVSAFGADLAAGTLPQVSWIIAQTNLSEHATYHPSAGEDLSARLIAQLAKYPEMYAKTAFILNYDEGGQFYDHHWTPTPPVSAADGISTVNVTGEVFLGLPIGLGFRVPLIIVSPWTRGGYVVSEVFDHTSVIKFVEKRFNVTCPNISPWRRAVTGDLTSAFDFANPDYTWPTLPDTSGYPAKSNEECSTLPPPQVPAQQSMPAQTPGTRPARPLPYSFDVRVIVNATTSTATLNIVNLGTAAGVFYMYNLNVLNNPPRKYTVEAGKGITDVINVVNGTYSYALHGTNGFVRAFAGKLSAANALQTYVTFDNVANTATIYLANPGSASTVATVTDNAYGLGGPWTVPLNAGATNAVTVSLTKSANWYDFTVSSSSDNTYAHRVMGHLENGKPSTSDPAMANPLHNIPEPQRHPDVPDTYRFYQRIAVGAHKDAMY